MFEFTEDYRLGIPTIDEEHENLIALLNQADEKLHGEDIDIQAFAKDLQKNLKEYANTHFVHEEAYMERINDPELPRQKKEHADFLQKVNEFPVNGNLSIQDLEDMMKYWVRWLFRHILHSDMMIGKRKAPESVSNDDPFAFTEQFVTGIDLIDSEHKVLFDIIRQANDLIQANLLHDKYDEIMTIMTELREYTEKHFGDEEEYMEKIGYPRIGEQKAAHAVFVEKLVDVDINDLDFIDDNQQEYLVDLINYLLDWLTNHIIKSDKLIGEWERK